MLRGIKTNGNRMMYTGIRVLTHWLPLAFRYGAGLAGSLMAAVIMAGAERMQWTASGEVALTI